MRIITGIPVSEGLAVGTLRLLRPWEAAADRPSRLTPAEELRRFQDARQAALKQLSDLYDKTQTEVGREAASIFQIHQMLLEDQDYLDAVKELLEQKNATAEGAAASVGGRLAAAFSALKNPELRARAADLEDITHRMVQLLTGHREADPLADGPAILLCRDLTPSQTVQLDRARLLGFVTQAGSLNSHTAVLARTLGIPALTGVDLDENWDGTFAALDGSGGQLYLDPTPQLLSGLEARRRSDRDERQILRHLIGLPNQTLDGREIQICANIGGSGDLEAALENDAQGVGLFRTELLFLESNVIPSEEDQLSAYRQAAEAMAGKRVVIRTLDIGADKRPPYLHLDPEENPALGYRGIRISLTQKELFRRQLRAILRASAFGRVAVMFPMIISVEEVRQAKEALAKCRNELLAQGTSVGEVEIGIMVETPAAALLADELAKEVDFFSIGTNDLTQYTLALDRQNPKLQPFYDPHHPAVLRLIQQTVEAGHRHSCWVGICGELGADQALTETFLRMGVDELSVSPPALLPLRRHIRTLNLSSSSNPG